MLFVVSRSQQEPHFLQGLPRQSSLRLRASTSGGAGSAPGQGSKIPPDVRYRAKRKTKPRLLPGVECVVAVDQMKEGSLQKQLFVSEMLSNSLLVKGMCLGWFSFSFFQPAPPQLFSLLLFASVERCYYYFSYFPPLPPSSLPSSSCPFFFILLLLFLFLFFLENVSWRRNNTWSTRYYLYTDRKPIY